ncbi:hypothetical protein BOFE_08740 (plasmid) [Candidatus Borrelia fainii]|uniref:Uncharacterized protein n=1 Tax=Candidatus Borrelia fainii TaxID=2518322 RepID=A0ABM8DLV0_9SPIR|nr:hypothetical protein [Candidatus Borrelia fainii]BDU63334.1 hypothetical protein BOFE_08740 [Candidatus Borrelia fainii]
MKRINVLLFMLCILSILVCKQGVADKSSKKIDSTQKKATQPGSNSKLVTPLRKKSPPLPSPMKIEEIHVIQGGIDNPPSVIADLEVTKIKTVDQAYDALSNLVTKYVDKLKNERVKFADKKDMYGLFYESVSHSFKDSDKRDKIFAALGHDTTVIDKLEDILDLVFNDETVYSIVIKNLFDELLEITAWTEELFIKILSRDGFNKLKKKHKDDILKIYLDVTKFIEARERLIGKLKNLIMLAGKSDDRELMINQINEINRHGAEFRIELYTMLSLVLEIRKIVEKNERN